MSAWEIRSLLRLFLAPCCAEEHPRGKSAGTCAGPAGCCFTVMFFSDAAGIMIPFPRSRRSTHPAGTVEPTDAGSPGGIGIAKEQPADGTIRKRAKP
jgi:hypothetical protein